VVRQKFEVHEEVLGLEVVHADGDETTCV
jgi:hypothetical protein